MQHYCYCFLIFLCCFNIIVIFDIVVFCLKGFLFFFVLLLYFIVLFVDSHGVANCFSCGFASNVCGVAQNTILNNELQIMHDNFCCNLNCLWAYSL